MNILKMARPEVRHFQPYLPGKPIQEVQRDLGLRKVVKLASNENALGASPKACSVLRKNSHDIYRYPEGPGTYLRRAIAKRLRVDESEVILGAGSDELIEILGKSFFRREDEIIASQHAFIRYKMAADLMGIKTIEVPMKGFTHDLSAMAIKINSRTKALFIANPNNPTGTYVSKGEVRDFFSILKRKGSRPFIVFDEAYYEYSRSLADDYPETLDYFKSYPNLIILRTFSKIYGLAGLRVGYGVMHRDVVRLLDRVRPPFNVSSVAQSAAIAALSDSGHVKKSQKMVKEEMKYLRERLAGLNIETVSSAGNFLLADVSPRRGSQVFQKLLKKGVIVRAMDEYGYPNHIRVTVGLPSENRFFIQKLKEVIEN